MPTETFLKLPDKKKEKILLAGKKEFARVSFPETSIKNIAQDAGIARGSFYQYFESKQDLLEYILKNHIQELNENLEKVLKEKNGDLFEIFINLYDHLVNECVFAKEKEFFKKIFENMKTTEDNLFSMKIKEYKPKEISNYYEKIDKHNLKIKSKEELEIVIKMLHTLTQKAVVVNYKYKSKEKAREIYIKQLEYIKYGILKNKESEDE